MRIRKQHPRLFLLLGVVPPLTFLWAGWTHRRFPVQPLSRLQTLGLLLHHLVSPRHPLSHRHRNHRP